MGRAFTCAGTERSTTVVCRDMPLSSNNTVRLPSASTAPMLTRRMNSVLPSSIVDGNFLARLHAVEKRRRGQGGKIAVVARDGARNRRNTSGYMRWLKRSSSVDVALQLGERARPEFFEIQRRQRLARAGRSAVCGRPARRAAISSASRPPAGRARRAIMSMTDSGNGVPPGSRFSTSRRLDAAREEEHRHVADHLAARRDFHDVAEKLVHLGVGAGDFRPAMRPGPCSRPVP